MTIHYDIAIVDHLVEGILAKATEPAGLVDDVRKLKNHLYETIPDKQRISRGITWVVQETSKLLAEKSPTIELLKELAFLLYQHLDPSDLLIGVPIFLMSRYGTENVEEVLDFFAETASSDAWVVREFAAGGFHHVITPNKRIAQVWLKKAAQNPDPSLRRFTSETLRPVTTLKWINDEPDYSLAVLGLLFKEAHPYPRTSVGNNLSDLSRRNPERIYSIAQELVELGDKNSCWIAARACRNLVKQDPERVMDILQTDEYKYKDRHYRR